MISTFTSDKIETRLYTLYIPINLCHIALILINYVYNNLINEITSKDN